MNILILVVTFSDDENILIFDKCFSPKSVVIADNVMRTVTLVLLPFDKMEKLDSDKVRNMCKVVFFNAIATATIRFDVGSQLTSQFKYIYNSAINITIQLNTLQYSTYQAAKYVDYQVTYPGQQPISFGVQSLRFLKKDVSNCFSNLTLEFSKHTPVYIKAKGIPASCQIDLTQSEVFIETNNFKIQIPPCTPTVDCTTGQFGNTDDFLQTFTFSVARDSLSGDELLKFDAAQQSLQDDIFQKANLQIQTQSDLISIQVQYILISDERGCAATMHEVITYNRNDVRVQMYGAGKNIFTCDDSEVVNILYYTVISNSTSRQTYSKYEPYSDFVIRAGLRFIEPSKVDFDPEKEDLIFDLIFVLYNANNESIIEFSRHGISRVGCIKQGTLVKYSDKICARMDYYAIPFCEVRNPNVDVAIRLYDEYKEIRTNRFWFGNFKLPSQVVRYNESDRTQEFCFTCDYFDPNTAFLGGTCENATKWFGQLLPKSAPKFTFRTVEEYAAFEYSAITFEWVPALWPAYLIFGVVAVVVPLSVIVWNIKQK
uniref:Transmembrane protein n=1 Tax=Trepomonas sp. PC1 TaxID=1076344 RepID=A0A146K5U8_9EUKA|eukprot:JAP90869.1 hypothetical protein TPC1_17697 [Trepomonas sp. PC1]